MYLVCVCWGGGGVLNLLSIHAYGSHPSFCQNALLQIMPVIIVKSFFNVLFLIGVNTFSFLREMREGQHANLVCKVSLGFFVSF